MRTALAIVIERSGGFDRRQRAVRSAHARPNTITVIRVLPESGPTRSFHCRASAIPVDASPSVVTRP